ncbi:MAG: phosphoglycerate mutase family protein [Patescibacteria group bacterium]|nr:phosphoglycerate mutase family protein [Patescibacteria group bacterium]
MMKLNNTYYLMRHGEAYSNKKPRWLSSLPEIKISHLTPTGKKKISQNAKKFKKIDIDLIFYSPLERTKETAKIINRIIKKPLFIVPNLKEIDFGIFNGLHPDVYWAYFENPLQRFTKKIPEGENLNQCLKRISKFFKKINKKYKNKKILIISHADILWLLEGIIRKQNKKQMVKNYRFRLKPGEFRCFEKTND